MKGRKLLLQEVLQLEDGCKVWVEELETKIVATTRNNRSEEWYTLISMFRKGEVCFYEDDEPTIIHNLATEICNLRSLDLTDENIEMIIKEFS